MPGVVILDWQGQPWVVVEAYATAHGFELYRGCAYTRGRAAGKRLSWILAPELAAYMRATREADLQLPLSHQTVYKMRKLLGLSIKRQVSDRGFTWTLAHLALLGQASDVDVAKAIGTTMPVVRGKRYALKIAAYRHVFWTADRVALLGTVPDRELAQKLGTSFAAVAKRRDILKIPAFGNWARNAKRAPRYQDPVSGATWSGFAVEPQWIKGQDRAQFVIGE
jgi:hypothetical protein